MHTMANSEKPRNKITNYTGNDAKQKKNNNESMISMCIGTYPHGYIET